MANYIKSLRDGTLTILDGTGTPNETEIVVAEGDLSIKETHNVVPILNRGALHEIKVGDEAPVEVSFSMKFHGFQVADSGVNPYEALTHTGGASGYTSTRATTQVVCNDLRFELAGVGGTTEETVTLSDFYVQDIEFTEGDPNMLKVSGKAWVTAPTIS